MWPFKLDYCTNTNKIVILSYIEKLIYLVICMEIYKIQNLGSAYEQDYQ